MPSSILLVEDERSIGALVRTYLERDGLAVSWVCSVSEALIELECRQPALILLDLGLPDGDGLELTRKVPPAVPVIMLTARGEEPERMAGFAAGADDYISKPFSPREVVARVRAVLRRSASGPADQAEELVLGDVRLSPAAREVRLDGRPVELTAKEFELLWHLMRHAGMVLTRAALLERVWGFESPGQSRTVDQHVAQLRQKLGRPELIRTVRGVGYKAAAR